MKFFAILLVTTLAAHAASNDPGKTALEFLENVRTHQIDLGSNKDTAVSSYTTSEKRREITKRLERLGRDLGTDPLETVELKMDGNYAGVIVRKVGGLDPTRLQVFAIALIKRGDDWVAAPLPASFENTGTRYELALRERLHTLENWMLREQVIELQKLRDHSAASIKKKIEDRITTDELRDMAPADLVDRFITACAAKDLPTVLGLLGGLANEEPNNWQSLLRVADHAMSRNSISPHSWQLMTSPGILRVVVGQDDDGSDYRFSVAFLNPEPFINKVPRIELIHLKVTKTLDDLWRIDLPESFFSPTRDSEDDDSDEADADLLNAFAPKWQAAHQTAPQATAPELQQKLNAAFKGRNLANLFALCHFSDDPMNARKDCLDVAEIVSQISSPSTVGYAVPLRIQESNNAAVAIFQMFSTQDPDRLNLKNFYFEKSSLGWLWTPTPSKATIRALHDQLEPMVQEVSADWKKILLASSYELREIPKNQAPAPEAARAVVNSWLSATRRGDLQAALALTAHCADLKSTNALLRNLGYEVTSAQRSDPAPAVLEVFKSHDWTGVGARTEQDEKIHYPLYPVIQTPDGPRILIEVDLFASPTREFLNKIALDQLEKFSSPETVEDLRNLLKQFQSSVEKPKK